MTCQARRDDEVSVRQLDDLYFIDMLTASGERLMNALRSDSSDFGFKSEELLSPTTDEDRKIMKSVSELRVSKYTTEWLITF